jgi:hypothetical protein
MILLKSSKHARVVCDGRTFRESPKRQKLSVRKTVASKYAKKRHERREMQHRYPDLTPYVGSTFFKNQTK